MKIVDDINTDTNKNRLMKALFETQAFIANPFVRVTITCLDGNKPQVYNNVTIRDGDILVVDGRVQIENNEGTSSYGLRSSWTAWDEGAPRATATATVDKWEAGEHEPDMAASEEMTIDPQAIMDRNVEIESLRNQLRDLTNHVDDLHSRNKRLSERNIKLHQERNDMDRTVTELRKWVAAGTSQIVDLEVKLNHAKEQHTHWRKNYESCYTTNERHKVELNEAEKTISQLNERIKSNSSWLDATLDQVRTTEHNYRVISAKLAEANAEIELLKKPVTVNVQVPPNELISHIDKAIHDRMEQYLRSEQYRRG